MIGCLSTFVQGTRVLTQQRAELTGDLLRGDDAMTGSVDNGAFTPGPQARPPRHAFEGTLELDQTRLSTDCVQLAEPSVLGGDPRQFPAVALGFVTEGDALVPVHRGLHRQTGTSYWDLMAGTGRLWSEASDGGLTRAAFAFQLSNERENESHHGLATFLFDDRQVSDLAVQKITETRPDHLPADFGLWGRVPARLTAGEPAGAPAARTDHRADGAEAFAIRPIGELAADCGRDLIDALAEGAGAASEIVAGLVVGDVIYATPMTVAHGAAPFPRAMRFGVWSATKSAFGALALMRLAHHLGPDIGETLVRDVIDVTAEHDGWRDVTVKHCLSMASGIGTASCNREPIDVYADNLTGPENIGSEGEACHRAYQAWYEARSRRQKLDAAFACPSYSWGPGEIARYRDQDLFMSGAAMDAVWKAHAGPQADLFVMVADEVYREIGIRGADMNRTIEPDGGLGLPLTAFGLFLGLDDVAKLGRLLSAGGVHGGEQLLDPLVVADALDTSPTKGLATGQMSSDGDITYHLTYWMLAYRSRQSGPMRLPTMRGYGGNVIQPLPNGMTAFRFAHDEPGEDDRYDALKLARIADKLEAF